MRIDAFPDVAEVCWVIIPVLSFSNIRMSPGFMLPLSSSAPVEIFLEQDDEMLEEVTISSTRGTRTIQNIPTGAEEDKGNVYDLVSDS